MVGKHGVRGEKNGECVLWCCDGVEYDTDSECGVCNSDRELSDSSDIFCFLYFIFYFFFSSGQSMYVFSCQN